LDLELGDEEAGGASGYYYLVLVLGPGLLGLGLGLRAAGAASPQDEPPRFSPTDVFVGIICGWTRHRRSLEANGFG
jgi:hypothetical protein